MQIASVFQKCPVAISARPLFSLIDGAVGVSSSRQMQGQDFDYTTTRFFSNHFIWLFVSDPNVQHCINLRYGQRREMSCRNVIVVPSIVVLYMHTET